MQNKLIRVQEKKKKFIGKNDSGEFILFHYGRNGDKKDVRRIFVTPKSYNTFSYNLMLKVNFSGTDIGYTYDTAIFTVRGARMTSDKTATVTCIVSSGTFMGAEFEDKKCDYEFVVTSDYDLCYSDFLNLMRDFDAKGHRRLNELESATREMLRVSPKESEGEKKARIAMMESRAKETLTMFGISIATKRGKSITALRSWAQFNFDFGRGSDKITRCAKEFGATPRDIDYILRNPHELLRVVNDTLSVINEAN